MGQLVMKFGGTSLGDAERIAAAAAIVRGRSARAPLVVASAMAGATNDLLNAAGLAGPCGGADALAICKRLEERHQQAARTLRVERQAVAGLPPETPDPASFIEARFAETRDRLRGVALLQELTERSKDAIAAAGELCASVLLAAAIPGAIWVDVRNVLRTDDSHGAANPDLEALEALAAAQLRPLARPDRPAVTQGYIGRTAAGATSTLGRGGSDYTASLLGAALHAEEIEIWTDVDGMLTADPRIVPSAHLLTEVAFEEASELAYFGAKVLHPATIRPALALGIPVRVLNTFRPEGRGTVIRDVVAAEDAPAVRAIAFRGGITVVLVSNPRMLMAHGWSARVFEVFARHRVSVDLIATSEVSISLTVDDASRLEPVVAELTRMADVTVLPQQAIVAVVGSGMRRRPGVAARVFSALGGINVVMISMGASDLNLSFVVSQHEAHEAMRRLHADLVDGKEGRA